jgi:hypothetical protein
MSAPLFDRSLLPPADFEFVVIGDTHYIRDPEIYASGSDSQDPRYTREWPARAERAFQLAAALEPAFVVHLGDLAQEFPGTDDFAESRREARAQIERHGLKPHHLPGNMDIGDKPNLTVPAPWVRPQDIAEWHEQFGRSWFGFDHEGIHCIGLNTQIMGGPLPEAEELKEWLQQDLADNSGKRIFLFLHMPPFFVDEDEPGLGSYNCLDEGPRAWLLELMRRYRVELLCAGHTHFAAYNRIDDTRFFIVPSTTTSRPGFNEVFPLLPEHRGKNDLDKLGFYLVRVFENGVSMHLIRTNGETLSVGGADGDHDQSEKSTYRKKGEDKAAGTVAGADETSRLLTRLSRDLPNSPLGANLRLPFAPTTPGVQAWPDAVPQRVRDDYPFLACLVLGVRHLRFAATALEDKVQRERLRLVRQEGISLTAIWLWQEGFELADSVAPYKEQIDFCEVHVPGALWPDEDCLSSIEGCRSQVDIPITLAPLMAREETPGHFHSRTRVGYRSSELAPLNRQLAEAGRRMDRVLCHVDADKRAWETVSGFLGLLPLSQIDSIDLVVPFVGVDEEAHADRAVEALLAAATGARCRLFLDPFVDVDRASDINHGLLDRLSNPRPVFHAVRCLNTILFADENRYHVDDESPGVGLKTSTKQVWHCSSNRDTSVDIRDLEELGAEQVTIYDLATGTSSRSLDEREQFTKVEVRKAKLIVARR